LVEVLVHLELADGFVPRKYQLLKVEVPEGVSTGRVAAAELPEGWEANTVLTRGIGDRWLMQGSSAVLEVPSAIVPETANWLLNPLHADAGSIGIAQHYGFGLDQRFLRFGPQ
jgi:RES domain-containing protein